MKVCKWIINKRNGGWLHPEFAVYKNDVKVRRVGWDWGGRRRLDISAKHYGWFWSYHVYDFPKDKGNIFNVLIRYDPIATKAWMDKFPVGTWITDEDNHRWLKKEDGKWYFHTEGMTSAELSKDGTRWTWVRSDNEDRD